MCKGEYLGQSTLTCAPKYDTLGYAKCDKLIGFIHSYILGNMD